ncbi:MAG: hypothetical protein QXD72_01530 [Candidatus Aenigmatarchaeota archaeon]
MATTNGYNIEGCKALIAAVIECARKSDGRDYLDYLRGPCGRFWITAAGYDPEEVFNALNTRRGERYTPLKLCPLCKGDVDHIKPSNPI